MIPQRDHSNGVYVRFPQWDSVRVEIHVRLTERNCITPLKVNWVNIVHQTDNISPLAEYRKMYKKMYGQKLVRLWENIFTLWDTIFHQSENILPQKGKKINNRNSFSSFKRTFHSVWRIIFSVKGKILSFEWKIFYVCRNENNDMMMWNWEFRLCLVLLVHRTRKEVVNVNYCLSI